MKKKDEIQHIGFEYFLRNCFLVEGEKLSEYQIEKFLEEYKDKDYKFNWNRRR